MSECERCRQLDLVIESANQKIDGLYKELDRKERLLNRLHNQLTMCEAARQRQESRNPFVRLREAWRSIVR